jgi:nitrous oxidase accessory protein NosD
MQQIDRDALTHESLGHQAGIVLLVDSQGNGDHSTIAAAIAQAPDHSTIFLAPGTYSENLIIDRPLTILGDENNRAEIAGRIVCDSDHILLQHLFVNSTHFSDTSTYFQNITASITQLKGDLQVKNCAIQAGRHNAFNLISPRTKLIASHCTIQNSEIGFYSNDRNEIHLDNCEIKHTERGILVDRGSEITLNHCQIHNSRSDGIKLEECDRVTLIHCKIFNTQGIGILLQNVLEFQISHTELFDHAKNGVCISQQSRGVLEQCKFHGNSWPSLALVGAADVEVNSSHFYEGFTEAIKLLEASRLKVTTTTIENHNEKAILVSSGCNLTLQHCSILRNIDTGLCVAQFGHAIVENTRFQGNGHGRKIAAIEVHGKAIVRYCSINRNHLGLQTYSQASVILKFSNLGFNTRGGLSIHGSGAINKSINYEGFKLPNLSFSWDKSISIGLISCALVAINSSSLVNKKAQSLVSEAQSKIESLQSDLDHEKTMRAIESTNQSVTQASYKNEKLTSETQRQTWEREKLALIDQNKILEGEKTLLTSQSQTEKERLEGEKTKLNIELLTQKAEIERLQTQLSLKGNLPSNR